MKSIFCVPKAWLFVFLILPKLSAQVNQPLEGQLQGLALDVRAMLTAERGIGVDKLRLDRISSFGAPDANFDAFIQRNIEEKLKDVLDPKATHFLKIVYAYIESDSSLNKGNKVIQISAKILDPRGKPIPLRIREGVVAEDLTREVNNTSDIARVLGLTVAKPPLQEYAQKLVAIDKAFEEPSFAVVDETRVGAKALPKYCVEIRKKAPGQSTAMPVLPIDQNGLAFVPVEIGETYEIILVNYDTSTDLFAKVEIDGLDISTAFCIDPIPAGASSASLTYPVSKAQDNQQPGISRIVGWLHTAAPTAKDNLFEFAVDKLGKGAASARGVTGSTGVITVQFFLPASGAARGAAGETKAGAAIKQDMKIGIAQWEKEPISIVSVRYSHAATP